MGKLIVKGLREDVISILAMQESNVATSTMDKIVRIFNISSTGEARLLSKMAHTGAVHAMLQVSDQLIATLEYGKNVTLWRAGTGTALASLRLTSRGQLRCCALIDDHLLIGTDKGDVTILKHTDGIKLNQEKTISKVHTARISQIAVHKDKFATASRDKSAIIFNSKFTQLSKIKFYSEVNAVLMDRDSIIAGCADGTVHIHENRNEYKKVWSLPLSKFSTRDIGAVNSLLWINSDVIMVTTLSGGLFFVSLGKRTCLAYLDPSRGKQLLTAKKLWDNKICVGGAEGYCEILSIPSEVRSSGKSKQPENDLGNKEESIIEESESLPAGEENLAHVAEGKRGKKSDAKSEKLQDNETERVEKMRESESFKNIFGDRMAQMKNLGWTRTTVYPCGPNELSSFLAAFLLNYDDGQVAEFTKMEKCLEALFRSHLVNGAMFVEGNEEEREWLFQSMTTALADETDQSTLVSLKFSLRRSIRLINQGKESGEKSSASTNTETKKSSGLPLQSGGAARTKTMKRASLKTQLKTKQ